MIRLIRGAVKGLARRVGLVSSTPSAPAHERQADYYNQMYANTGVYQVSYERSHYYFIWSVIVDRLRSGKVQRVLEIGCGPGQLAAYALDQGVASWTGLDFSATSIEMAKKNCPRGTFVVGDARDSVIHAQVEHDVVICTEVLEHITEDLLVMGHFKSGKRCICTVPNFPYESHVRHFKDADEVLARYGAFFSKVDVMTLKSPQDPADRFFLIDGIRNDYAPAKG